MTTMRLVCAALLAGAVGAAPAAEWAPQRPALIDVMGGHVTVE